MHQMDSHEYPQTPFPKTPISPSKTTTPDETPRSNFPATFLQKIKTNLAIQTPRWAEFNGAMGDLGTFIPIVLALALAKDLNLGTTLIFTGAYNILSGAIYGVPMPIQPMKSIVAVALSNDCSDFGLPEIMAAGICTGGIMLVLGVTGLMQLVYRLVPASVVSGVQLAQGLSFAFTAIVYIEKMQDFSKSSESIDDHYDRHWLGLDGLVLAISCACFVLYVDGVGNDNRHRDQNLSARKLMGLVPTASVIFLMGIIISLVRMPKVVNEIKFGPPSIRVVNLSKRAWKQGFIKGTIPQLPLTVLNSVIAVCKLSSDIFPGKELSATLLSVTVGLMNVVGCWFGAMPCCHGAGGLAGHYKFGGRSGGCVAILGTLNLVLGLVLGGSLVKILVQFPVGFLGVMLMSTGIELAMASRNTESMDDCFVMLVCTVVSLVGSDSVVGFVCGIVVHLLLRIRRLSKVEYWCSIEWICGKRKKIDESTQACPVTV